MDGDNIGKVLGSRITGSRGRALTATPSGFLLILSVRLISAGGRYGNR